MNVLLVSQCDKRALTETRRILDQFAERRGDRTWQTPITQDGLDTLRKLLRQSARKNTAVACHWVRGLDHTELIWVVGDRSRFNEMGAVPTNTTQRNVLRAEDENDWHSGEDIRLLAQLAALLHDLGKASLAFQNRLRSLIAEKNLYRHEWVSLRLFLAFVGADDDATWLTRLAQPTVQDEATWLAKGRYWRDGMDLAAPPPFANLPPLAAAIAWLVVTHHRLPTVPAKNERTAEQDSWLGKKSDHFNPTQLAGLLGGVHHGWNEVKRGATAPEVAAHWKMDVAGLPVYLPKWRAQASKVAQRLFQLRAKSGKGGWLDNPYVMHVARLTLMLADHHYSSLPPKAAESVKGDEGYKVFANTHSDRSLKQPLDEHLLGVARDAGRIAYGLPDFARHLRHLPMATLRKRAGAGRFHWQDRAADEALSLRSRAAEHGAFIVNMASTGCGKTLGNARIMNAIADPKRGLRCSFALGLRALTLQTGRSYRQTLRLGEDELAVRVGGSASRELFEYHEQLAEASGSASSQALMEEDGDVHFDADSVDASADAGHHGLLGIALRDERIRRLLTAPLLVCTIDHLMPATEAQRAGRQIAPMLRLMSSDLVLDELDDFDLADLPALARLVHWAGLLGARVLLSSATLPPALLDGMFEAYRQGRLQFARNRGLAGGPATGVPEIACLWVDEFVSQPNVCVDLLAFRTAHENFVQQRVMALDQVAPRRRGVLIPLALAASTKEGESRRAFAVQVHAAVQRAHADHAQACPHSGKRVSFGVVRMANIAPLFDVALELFRLGAPAGTRIHLCVYHARFPLLLRSAIERRLDLALDRRKADAVFSVPEIRQALDAHAEQDHVFVVLASPVCEVGRDWDLDWAVVEPSSMRSLIQLAGRVQRHRNQACTKPNIYVFDTNLRHFEHPPGRAAFIKPGFESQVQDKTKPFRLDSHSLGDLLEENEYASITSRPRIQPRAASELRPKASLVDLEHAQLEQAMGVKERAKPPQPVARGLRPEGQQLDAACAWLDPQALLTWALPQHQPFRDDPERDVDLVFLPDDHEPERLVLHRIHQEAKRGQAAIYVREESEGGGGRIEHIDLNANLRPGIAPWGQNDLVALLQELAEARSQPMQRCAERFTPVSVPKSDHGWRYHPALGFAEK